MNHIVSSNSFFPIKKNYNCTIILTHNCNFNCWYCYDKPNRDKHKNVFIDVKHIKSFIENIEKQNINVSVNILGGEPTLHPLFLEILKFCTSKNILNVTVTSNFSCNLQTYIDSFSILKEKLCISLSVHFSNLQKFKQEVLQLSKYGNINISLMMDSKINIDEIQDTKKYFEDTKLHMILVPLHNTVYDHDVQKLIDENHSGTKKIIKITHSDGTTETRLTNDIARLNYNPFKDMHCESLYMNWSINPYGKIISDCTLDKNVASKFNCYDDSFFEFLEHSKKLKCQLDSCHCFVTHKKWV
jgi:MoaA/NifB/PqqE/SkfB family radical SAM enzyme